jgi:hypothetical protein
MRDSYKGKKLKLVSGSLGVNGWFEFGGKKWTKKDFEKKIDGYTTDAHAWLEDEEGNVYDFLFKEYNYWSLIRTKQPLKRTGLLEGVSKADLAKDGIEYVPAPKDAQLALFLAVNKHCLSAYVGLKNGSYSWFGNYLLMCPK